MYKVRKTLLITPNKTNEKWKKRSSIKQQICKLSKTLSQHLNETLPISHETVSKVFYLTQY